MRRIRPILPVKLGSTPIRACFLFTFYSHLVCKTPFDVYLFYSVDTLRIIWELKNKKATKKYVIQSDPTKFIWNHSKFIHRPVAWDLFEKNKKHSYYLEPGLKPWNFLSLILPGPRLIIWILPAALTYLIKYFLSFIHHPVSWDLFQKDWTFIVWDKCMINMLWNIICKMIIIRILF